MRAFGHPWRTIIEGTSFGATVTAIQAEKFAFSDDGTPNFDAAMPLCELCVGTPLQGYLLSDQWTV